MTTRFHASAMGHCFHRKKTRNKFEPKLCDFWESNAEVKAERTESLKKSLEDISQRLNGILDILSNNE